MLTSYYFDDRDKNRFDNINKLNQDKPKEYTQINIHDLYRDREEIKEKKNSNYRAVLHKIHKKIKKANSLERNKISYDVPEYVVGVPVFNLNKCISYIIKQLRGNGFLVKYYFPKMLYISWDAIEIQDYKQTQRLIKKGYKELDNHVSKEHETLMNPNSYYTPKTDPPPVVSTPPVVQENKSVPIESLMASSSASGLSNGFADNSMSLSDWGNPSTFDITFSKSNATNVPQINVPNTMGGASFMSPSGRAEGFSTTVQSAGSAINVEALMADRQKDLDLARKLQPERTQHNTALFKPMLNYNPNVIPTHNYYAYSTLNQKLVNERYYLENGPRQKPEPISRKKQEEQRQKIEFNRNYQREVDDYYGGGERSSVPKLEKNHPFSKYFTKSNSEGKYVIDL